VRWLREGVKVFDRFLVRRKMQARGDGKVGKGKALETLRELSLIWRSVLSLGVGAVVVEFPLSERTREV